MKFQQSLLVFLCIYILSCHGSKTTVHSTFPNILVLIADDLGYSDLRCFGGEARTPNLDRLAASGIRMTSLYSAAPNCSPSRAGLLTGRDPNKVGIYNYLPPGHPMHVSSEEITLAEIVKKKGYRTGHFGKWHLSSLNADVNLGQPQPSDQGFDHSFGTSNNANPSHLNPDNFIRNGSKVGSTEGYSCDLVAQEALSWIEDAEGDRPFFAYLAFHEPHKRVASPPSLVTNYPNHSQQHAEYLANVENLDAAIGRVLAAIKEEGRLQNTLVLFASDNGSYRNGSNAPLLGGKSFVYEGGIRVPGILAWPAKIEHGRTVDEGVSLLDLMPTLCDLLDVEHPQTSLLDGVSLMPMLEGRNIERSESLSWFFYRTSPEMALRQDNLVITGWSTSGSLHTHRFSSPDMDHLKTLVLDTFQLYDLETDLGQKNPIAWQEHAMGPTLKSLLEERLTRIQENGHYWSDLPPATGVKKLKAEWRQLHPTGFSN